jgi:hypothetical protein
MKKKLLHAVRILGTVVSTGVFSAFVFGQGSASAPASTPLEEVIRIAGWVAIVGAGVTYVTLSIYNAIRGKDYEQLKEALSNYKELAESRKAKIAERDAQVGELKAENILLEKENERLAEKVLRL